MKIVSLEIKKVEVGETYKQETEKYRLQEKEDRIKNLTPTKPEVEETRKFILQKES